MLLTEIVNRNVLKRGFEKTKDLGWYELVAVGDMVSREAKDPPTLTILAKLKGKRGHFGRLDLKIAQGEWNQGSKEENLTAGSVEVDDEYQRRGVATQMYKFAKELGNTILPSISQSDDAKKFWAGAKAKGDL